MHVRRVTPHARPKQPARKLATYEDLLALPEGTPAEISRGEIVTLPAPRPRHSKAQRALGHFVGGPFDDDDGAGGPGGWWIFVEVEIRFELHEVVRPDLSGWRRERLLVPDVLPIDVAATADETATARVSALSRAAQERSPCSRFTRMRFGVARAASR